MNAENRAESDAICCGHPLPSHDCYEDGAGHQGCGYAGCSCPISFRQALAARIAQARAEALRQAQAEWASEYDRLTREHPGQVKSRAAYRMASVLAGQRADAVISPATSKEGDRG